MTMTATDAIVWARALRAYLYDNPDDHALAEWLVEAFEKQAAADDRRAEPESDDRPLTPTDLRVTAASLAIRSGGSTDIDES